MNKPISLVTAFKGRPPKGIHQLIIPDMSGHRTMTWTGRDDVAEVRAEFDRMMAAGWTGYAEPVGGGDPVVIKQFDETAARIAVFPALVGG
jgi:hypothetical protein